MINVLPITAITEEEIKDLGHNGYQSGYVYKIVQQPDKDTCSFMFEVTPLDTTFHKTWTASAEDIAEYNQLLPQGHSYGAFEDGKLVGFIIAEARSWNNTMYVAVLSVSSDERKKGIGSLLLDKLIAHTARLNYRLLELETQNTNVPAVSFYLKRGFNITGVNLKLYDPAVNPGEMAFYMTYELRR